MDKENFNVIILGIIFNPKEKKILIGKRENGSEGSWEFPGGKAIHREDVDKTLKRHSKAKTGYVVKNLGTFFSENSSEKDDLILIYFLTEVFEGEEKPGDDFVELKWIHPKELGDYLTTSAHKKLKEYLTDLV
ncbi:NUDIX hydrolase [Candidatus Pacearchaeota archaeon]|nr:NUDIX hydrolase [Candidatus Pacearchaeota archaeon]